jgi:predicted RNase H-like nuclease (RuvC/YqgF family)
MTNYEEEITKAIAKIAAPLGEKESALAGRESSLEAKIKVLESETAAIAAKEQELAKLQKSLSAREKKIKDFDSFEERVAAFDCYEFSARSEITKLKEKAVATLEDIELRSRQLGIKEGNVLETANKLEKEREEYKDQVRKELLAALGQNGEG